MHDIPTIRPRSRLLSIFRWRIVTEQLLQFLLVFLEVLLLLVQFLRWTVHSVDGRFGDRGQLGNGAETGF